MTIPSGSWWNCKTFKEPTGQGACDAAWSRLGSRRASQDEIHTDVWVRATVGLRKLKAHEGSRMST